MASPPEPLSVEQIKAYNQVIKNAFKRLRLRDDAALDVSLTEETSVPTIRFRWFEFIDHRTFTWDALETVR